MIEFLLYKILTMQLHKLKSQLFTCINRQQGQVISIQRDLSEKAEIKSI